MEEGTVDYKELYNKLERENISLRMYIIKMKSKGSTILAQAKSFFSDNDNISLLYCVSIIVAIIVPIIRLLLDMREE
jgi:hypothetical protein